MTGEQKNTISKATISSDIWKLFRDRIFSEVKSTTLSDKTNITVKNISAGFPDKIFDTKENYPIFIINQPYFSTNFFTYGKTQVNGYIDILVYTTQALAAESFTDQIINTIEKYRPQASELNLYDIQLDSIDINSFTHGALKIHNRRIRFGFQYTFNRTMN